MNILAFAATSNTKSINRLFVKHAANKLVQRYNQVNIEHIDLNDYELPIFSEDKEAQLGQPPFAREFLDKIQNSDAVIVSFAEHNGSYTAAYKNIFDWASRINPKVFQNKPMLLLATSPGPGGGSSVLASAKASIPHFGGIVIASLSLPSFYDNFNIEQGRLTHTEITQQLLVALDTLVESIYTQRQHVA